METEQQVTIFKPDTPQKPVRNILTEAAGSVAVTAIVVSLLEGNSLEIPSLNIKLTAKDLDPKYQGG